MCKTRGQSEAGQASQLQPAKGPKHDKRLIDFSSNGVGFLFKTPEEKPQASQTNRLQQAKWEPTDENKQIPE